MSVYAETVTVQAQENFSTLNPSKCLTVRFLNDIQIDKNLTIKEGDFVKGIIFNVTEPKRLKRNAKFSFQLVGVENSSGVYIPINDNYYGTYTTKLNSAHVAKSAALGVGNFFVKGLSMGYYAVEGAVENEQGNRLKSSAVSLYENSPVSYVEKGGEINIKKGDMFYLKFKTYKPKKIHLN